MKEGFEKRACKGVSLRFSYVIFVSLLILVSLANLNFALDISKAAEIYKSYLSVSSDYYKETSSLVNLDLPLYRFFKIYFVGSKEKTETTKKTGDYLEALKPFENASSDEEKLAKAMFLAYWEAKLNNRKFDSELIKSSPIFNDFFNDYQFRIVGAFGNYAQDLSAYLFGADINLEHIPEELQKLRKNVIGDYVYTPVYNGEEEEVIALLIKEPEVIKSISEIITEAQQNSEQFDPETLIMRTRGTIFRSTFGLIAGLKNEIAKEFVRLTPVKANYLWLRWVAYIILFLVWYFGFKNVKIPLLLMISAETVYIGTFFSIQSTVDGMIYGIVLAIAIFFSLFYFLVKKEYVYFVFSLALGVVLFIPSFATRDLLMQEQFENSPFYRSLIEDIFKDDLSVIKIRLKDYNTIVNESVSKFSTLLSDLEIDTFDLPEELFVPENFEKRIQYAKSIGADEKDHKKEIEDFIYFESKRFSKVQKLLRAFEKDFAKFASVGSDGFRNYIIDFIESNFQSSHAKMLVDTVAKTKKSSYVLLPTYKVFYGLSASILLALALFLTALKREEAFVPLIGSVAVSLLTLLKTQTVFIQVGVPSISMYVNWLVPYILAVSLGFGIYWLYKNHILRRRERV
ncbi:MAG: hypothetical protein WHS64_02020 [Fervidobacterium sp.]|uniref:Uncharacterized protein n=1 Tax=Fervidobacterium gondwanense DSM 13020 TaxID=1121883 RepID=A0A1M7RVT0_FERGO|nr:hypothetical protein [Fervidobacterium gondwanense]UXF01950.1 hypothetical protein IB67_10700 [Fervidobacterium riparium]SHN50301.1 hypothetical protein SAMN02745226_00225 [Fervidobacterium gondwanense DSM 13020]